MNSCLKDKILSLFNEIYDTRERAEKTMELLECRLSKYDGSSTEPYKKPTQKDAVLITYGNSLKRDGEPGLATLEKFLKKYVGNAISTVHLLPMFPYTSDDGFSVVDYRTINPELGDWDSIETLSQSYELMFDAVLNHISAKSSWFQHFLACEKPYDDFFIVCDPKADYTCVTRPRTLPLLTKFNTAKGEKYVWTTFSTDQIDLNYQCPQVMAQMLELLVFYGRKGARIIRMDAICYLWKQLGTSCVHLKQTHCFIKIARLLLEHYSPGTMILTEANVPQEYNLSYFGTGDEAQMVYQFPLPPLVMYTLRAQTADILTDWASALPRLKPGEMFFNFLSSHDGIGLNPSIGILDDSKRQFLVDSCLRSGGRISYKDNGDGRKSPYEMNINYQDALSSPEECDDVRIGRFLAAETILLSLQGIPALYIHSLLGSRNDYYGMTTSDINHRINREQMNADFVEQQLNSGTCRGRIFHGLVRLLRIRRKHPAFSPEIPQTILKLNNRLFSLMRGIPGETEVIYAVINISCQPAACVLPITCGTDLISGIKVSGHMELSALQSMWIKEDHMS